MSDYERETDFMQDGACLNVNPDIFFPEKKDESVALAICAECIVKSQCLDYALRNHINSGIWGGASEQTRRKIIRVRHERAGQA